MEDNRSTNISDFLKDDVDLFEIAKRIEEYKVDSREELVMEIIRSEEPRYNEVYRIETTRVDNEMYNFARLNRDMTLREILLSKLIGSPVGAYAINGFRDYNKDWFQNTIRRSENPQAKLAEIAKLREQSQDMEARMGRLEFGSNEANEKSEGIVITDKELLAAGLNPSQMGWTEISRETVEKNTTKFKKAQKELKEMEKHGVFDSSDAYHLKMKKEHVSELEARTELSRQDYEKYVVTPRKMARVAEKNQVTHSEVKGVKAFFDRILGRDNRVTENDGRDEQ